MINRDDMLELTRRMSSSRTHLMRVAGAYMDAEGFEDGSFNVSMLELKGAEKTRTINIAKAIPFADTNVQLKEYALPAGAMKSGSIWQLLYALRDCGLKNDALMMTFYELIGEQIPMKEDYTIFLYLGVYDVPRKGSDAGYQYESEEVYTYLICAVGPQEADMTPGQPTLGFLWPAFKMRSCDMAHVNVFAADAGQPAAKWLDFLGLGPIRPGR